MNTTYTYNRAHDDAHRLARRHERDLHWAKERRRQHERELGEARLLLATKSAVLARRSALSTLALIVGIVGAEWLIDSAGVLADWRILTQWVAAGLVVAVLIGALVSVLKLRRVLAAARTLVRNNDARLAHTQYHINESVHLFIDSRVEVLNTRQVHAV